MVVQYSTYRMIQYASATIDWYNQRYCTHKISGSCPACPVLAERLAVLPVEIEAVRINCTLVLLKSLSSKF